MSEQITTKTEHLEVCNQFVELRRTKQEMGIWFDKTIVLPILLKIYEREIIRYEENNPYRFNNDHRLQGSLA